MNFSELIGQAQQAVSVISNPNQASVFAAGAAGAFSAEINNLRKQASADLTTFGVKVPKPLQSVVNGILQPAQSVLAGSPSNPIPSGSGSILGFSYIQAALIGAVGFIILIFMLGRAVR